MKTRSKIQLLQNMPLFGGVTEETLQFLLSQAPLISLNKGETFFRENDEGHSLFVIYKGEAIATKQLGSKEYILSRFQTGDSFGEMAIVDMSLRCASVKAIKDTTAIEITASMLYELYQKDLSQFTIIQMNVSREICRRLRSADEKIFSAINQPQGKAISEYRFQAI